MAVVVSDEEGGSRRSTDEQEGGRTTPLPTATATTMTATTTRRGEGRYRFFFARFFCRSPAQPSQQSSLSVAVSARLWPASCSVRRRTDAHTLLRFDCVALKREQMRAAAGREEELLADGGRLRAQLPPGRRPPAPWTTAAGRRTTATTPTMRAGVLLPPFSLGLSLCFASFPRNRRQTVPGRTDGRTDGRGGTGRRGKTARRRMLRAPSTPPPSEALHLYGTAGEKAPGFCFSNSPLRFANTSCR